VGVHFFLEKVDDLFSRRFNRQAKNTKLTTPNGQISPSIFPKIGLLLCLGLHFQLSPVNLAPNFYSALGVHPLATPVTETCVSAFVVPSDECGVREATETDREAVRGIPTQGR